MAAWASARDRSRAAGDQPGGAVHAGRSRGTGLTGRKLVVDAYGAAAPVGGGAFSGKDPTKVDRSAAYAARHIAVNLLAGGFASEALVRLSYAIGVAQPVSIDLETFGTSRYARGDLLEMIGVEFDLRPGAIRRSLRLHAPIYRRTAAYGHFGRDDLDLPWERRDAWESPAAPT